MRDYTGEDRRVRERLERGSPSGARRDIAGMLNAMAKADAAKEAPGLAAIEGIRDLQKKSGYRTAADHNRAHAKFEALQRSQAAGSEGFNRPYPRHKLASAPVGRTWRQESAPSMRRAA